ncbi:ABC-F family ATP-binding cassette domain-containing protein [Phenylobacterium soli]|uniref:ABC transporter ATP-binding protein n=1 Tax=Phenylobacterium soli TaxID=2170551 RepID=A0A328AMD8_9CAUL|nr:ABC-F family ATP-binding cassette domain-containing protein [Phenylobacterium soli]RAK55707.1 ABC transporter ATP-binding protein [Phenylobacterium soli]
MSAPSTPAFLTLDSVAARTPDGRTLFEDLTLALGRERTGLVGRNGVGKTTLLRILSGEADPAEGAVARTGSVGVLAQSLEPPPGACVADLMGLAEPLARLSRIAGGEGDAEDLAEADWTLEARLEAALAGVGLAGLDLQRPAADLSGGQRTRAALAGLIARGPDVLLLDEPTNNLDAAGRALVAEALGAWSGGAVVVSHDRALLRRMDRIVELTSLGARIYGGGYDLYAERKAAEEAAAARDLAEAERAVARASREAQAATERQARRDAAGRRFAARRSEPKILLGRQAERAENSGGRGDRLAERQKAEAVAQLAEAGARVERLRTLAFDLPPSGLAAGKTVLVIEDAGFAYAGGPPVLSGFSLRITGPERIALQGPNGAGKTTAIRLAAGELSPTVGAVRLGVRPALVDQQTAILKTDETLIEAYRRLNPAATINDAHAALARFLFRNRDAGKRVGALSGGERLRAALACVLAGEAPPQLLILDEPTNHLDLDSIAAVEAALRGYDGALLVASHDPDFLAEIGVARTVSLRS